MSRTTAGTLITAISNAKMTFLPRNSIRESAYPASESKNTLPAVTAMVTIIEFLNQTGKSELRKSFRYDAFVNVAGMRESGFAVASASVLNDVAIWMMNGRIYTSAKATRRM